MRAKLGCTAVPRTVSRVLLDATAVPRDRGGVGRYVDNLIPALVRGGLSIEVACLARDAEIFAGMGAEPLVARAADRGRAGRLLWEQTGLPVLARRRRPDVLHCPHYTQPARHAVATAVTLHDATFFTAPGLHGRVKGPFFRSATRLAVRRADAAVVPSQATADELVRVARADPRRLHVAHHGVDPAVFAPPAAADAALARRTLGLDQDRPYVAFLGTLEPRKNLSALVRGFAIAVAGRADRPVLVLAGGRGWDDGLADAIADLPLGVEVLQPGYLPIEQIAGYLGGAAVVAYPSLGEGFGLPVLEAMACGAAVLTTRRLALPEVGGDAVAYCDVDDASIGRALRELLEDPAACAKLGAAALARASMFTWDACASAHVTAYEAAAGRWDTRRR
jgi:glycosyltransferase involved in cell wall biosynthesis